LKHLDFNQILNEGIVSDLKPHFLLQCYIAIYIWPFIDHWSTFKMLSFTFSKLEAISELLCENQMGFKK